MTQCGTWINIHQNKSDRIVGMVTRKMKKAGLIDFYSMNLQGVNEIVVEGVKHKVYSLQDLQQFCPHPVDNFLTQTRMDTSNDSAIVLE